MRRVSLLNFMRHPVRLYIAFSAFVLFISMTVGMLFWFSMQTAGTQAESINNAKTLTSEYQQQMDKFFGDYSAATDKIEFLKTNQQFLFNIKVPKEFLDKHFNLVVNVDKVIGGIAESTIIGN